MHFEPKVNVPAPSATSCEVDTGVSGVFTSREAFQRIIDIVPNPVFVKDRQHRFVFVNQALANLLGLSPEEMLGKSDFDFFPKYQAEVFWAKDDEVFASGVPDENEEEFTDASGIVRTILTRKSLVHFPSGETCLSGVISEVTQYRAAEARARHLAYHDPLTGLGNRTMLRERLDHALAEAQRSGDHLALLYFDLDGFKAVNDLQGHQAGDRLLRAVADRLRSTTRETDIAARVGGDEFVVVQTHVKDLAAVECFAARLVRILSRRYELESDHVAIVSTSIGIAVAPDDGVDSEQLLTRADAALYRVKANGRNGFAFFRPEMDAAVRARRELEHDLRLAVSRGEFSLAYQPQADAATGEIVGFEALLRWQHPARGAVPPGDFISTAEACGAIIPIGSWVLREACREAAKWQAALRLAVNVSPLQVLHRDFADMVEDALADSGLQPQRLEIEITESLLIREPEQALAALRRVKALGISVAIDDFGTGYSSLGTLRAFPFDRVKVDRSFVKDLPGDAEASAIVQAVLGLGRGLGLPVLAEGVETEAQLAALRAGGCSEVQGFLIERPKPVAAYRAITHPAVNTNPASVSIAGKIAMLSAEANEALTPAR